MAVWMVRVLGGQEPPAVASTRLSDVDGSHWWASHVERFAELGVTAGYTDGTFRPGVDTSRAHMAAFINRALDLVVFPPPRRFTAVDSGGEHTCALRTDGTVSCWGNNDYGQANAPDGQFEAVTLSLEHTCGLRTDGTVECWGASVYGRTDAPDGRFDAVSAGRWYTCGLRADGTVVCWGYNYKGQTDAPDGEFDAVSADSGEATVALSPIAAPGDGIAVAAVPLSDSEAIVVESRCRIGYDTPTEYSFATDGVRGSYPALGAEGVLVYTVDASLWSGSLPIKVAGDTGDGQVGDYPILTPGQSVTVHGYTIAVISDDGATHTVTITKTQDSISLFADF